MLSPAPDWTWADVEAEVQPRTDTVDLCLDGTLQAQIEDVRRRLAQARNDDALDAGTSELQAELDRLETKAQESTRTFDVVACGHKRWRELLVKHQSDNPGERWNAETFVPAAIAECCPQFESAEQVAAAQELLTLGQISKLFNKVKHLNEGDDQVPLMRGR